MPIYEYRCQACGHELEALQGINEPTLTNCPSCGKSQLQRLVSAAGFQLKGTGWYVTDFKDKKPTETKTENKTTPETKPDKPKPEPKTEE